MWVKNIIYKVYINSLYSSVNYNSTAAELPYLQPDLHSVQAELGWILLPPLSAALQNAAGGFQTPAHRRLLVLKVGNCYMKLRSWSSDQSILPWQPKRKAA